MIITFFKIFFYILWKWDLAKYFWKNINWKLFAVETKSCPRRYYIFISLRSVTHLEFKIVQDAYLWNWYSFVTCSCIDQNFQTEAKAKCWSGFIEYGRGERTIHWLWTDNTYIILIWLIEGGWGGGGGKGVEQWLHKWTFIAQPVLQCTTAYTKCNPSTTNRNFKINIRNWLYHTIPT